MKNYRWIIFLSLPLVIILILGLFGAFREIYEPVEWEPVDVRQTYAIQWKITYSDGSSIVEWQECSEESYNVFKGFLESGGFDEHDNWTESSTSR